MGKLGKKARKFAKKNLQSVLKRKRKLKSMFKRKTSKRDNGEDIEDEKEDEVVLSNLRKPNSEELDLASLDAIFAEDDSDADGDDSDSDGYLSEDSSVHVAEPHGEDYQENNDGDSALSVQNREIYLEFRKKTKMLDRLKEKDPKFSKFLDCYYKELKPFRNKEAANTCNLAFHCAILLHDNLQQYADEDEDEDEMGNACMPVANGSTLSSSMSKLFTSTVVDRWCELVKEQQSLSALTCLLNTYRAACHFGVESNGTLNADLTHGFQNSETFCKILIFMLNEADTLFKGLLGLSSSNVKKQVLELKKSAKWNKLEPLIKSYLRSTLFLLNQVTDTELLTYSLDRARASVKYFVVFPSFLHRFVQVVVHLWAKGGGNLSSYAFLLMRDLMSIHGSYCFETCFVKLFKSFIGHCQSVEPARLKHMLFLKRSFVELCSIEVQKSSSKAMISIQQLSKMLQQALLTKKKEALKNICSWKYTSCIDLWVMFISANIRDYDLQSMFFVIIQIINGVAALFPGPRYLPLRIKCIQWLNHLSVSSGIFIPVASLALDSLEYKTGKDSGGKSGQAFTFSTSIKLPKHWLKSRDFQQQCVLSTIELLSEHFAQWSYHISFPELATIPLIRLRKFIEMTTIENFRRVVKRFIDQVEQNVDFVKKKRDEVAFSPNDQELAGLFLQLERQSGNTPFTQYYKSIMDKASAKILS